VFGERRKADKMFGHPILRKAIISVAALLAESASQICDPIADQAYSGLVTVLCDPYRTERYQRCVTI